MNFTLTARHFKAHDTLKEFAESEIEKITKFYDGIIKSEVILSFEKPTNSIKNAEVIVKINNHHIFQAILYCNFLARYFSNSFHYLLINIHIMNNHYRQ